jgi:hypothetical protein
LWRNAAAVLPMLLSEPLAKPVTKRVIEILVVQGWGDHTPDPAATA